MAIPSDPPIVHGGKDDGASASGWCYVDPARNAQSTPEIVKDCPANTKRILRFAGDTLAGNDSTLFMACTGE